MIKSNSIKAWWLASRPKTLSGAVVPVMVGLAAAWMECEKYSGGAAFNFKWIPALLCLSFAMLMQIDANFINDYFDYVKGIDDEERLGPKRACAQGWVSLFAMQRAIAGCTVLSIAVGLPLIFWGGAEMIIVGIACIAFCFLYTTLLARLAMGDVLVLLCFGIIPVCTTFYIQIHTLTWQIFMLSLCIGIVTDTLLIVNNYRDRDTDIKHEKYTLVTIIGPKATKILYCLCGIISTAIALWSIDENADRFLWNILLYFPFLMLHIWNTRKLIVINKGAALNQVLGKTALAILIFGIATSISLLLPKFI